MKYTSLIVLQSLLLGAAAMAQNAVIFGNVHTNGGHSDGGVLATGSWTGSNYEANSHSVDETGIYLGGNNSTSGFLRAKGVSYIAGTKGTFDGTLGNPDTPDFAYYQGLSGNYSAASTGTSANFSDMNNVTLFLTPGLNVFDVSASQLTGTKTLGFSGDTTADVVFNVTGNIPSWGITTNYDPNKVTWNFVDATVINIDQRNFRGSIVAPNAHVNQSQNIDGTLIAKQWTVNNSVELHSYSLVDVPALIPEPSALIIGAGLLLVTLPRRKR